MKLNAKGLALIKRHEGLRLKSYKCPAGVWTIGYGHTSAAGQPEVKPNMRITQAQADAILESDLEKFASQILPYIKVDLTPNQFSALLSFAYNVGVGAFKSSSVLKAVNAKQFSLVPARLALWNKGGGRVLPGLVKRRAEEGALFVGGKGDEVFPSTKITPSQGKKPLASTTNIAATIAGTAATTSAIKQVTTDASETVTALGFDVRLLFTGLLIAGGLAAAYIIFERIRKSRNEGV